MSSITRNTKRYMILKFTEIIRELIYSNA